MFNNPKISVAFQDSCIQIMYDKNIIEKVLPLKDGRERITCVREILYFDEMALFLQQAFREILPIPTLLFGNVEVYATYSPLSGILEKRIITDLFNKIRCIKKVKLIEFPIATLVGLRLNNQKSYLLIDLDTHCCYISLIDNGKVILFKDIHLCSIGGILKVAKNIIINSTNQIEQCWLVGENVDVVDCYAKIRSIGFPIHTMENPNYITINGLAMLAENAK